MQLLAFDTSTDRMSVGVSRGVPGHAQLWLRDAAGGALASTDLIATVLDLLQQAGLGLAELDAICFGCGPGSFTGLRTACAVAQGLAMGAGVPVLPLNSLMAVAEDARSSALAHAGQGQVTALLDARMDEMYAARFAFSGAPDGLVWTELQPAALCRPEALSVGLQAAMCQALAGNVFSAYGARLQGVPAGLLQIAALPSAAALLRLAPQALAAGQALPAAQALPLYVRNNVAQTTAQRAATRAAQALAGP